MLLRLQVVDSFGTVLGIPINTNKIISFALLRLAPGNGSGGVNTISIFVGRFSTPFLHQDLPYAPRWSEKPNIKSTRLCMFGAVSWQRLFFLGDAELRIRPFRK